MPAFLSRRPHVADIPFAFPSEVPRHRELVTAFTAQLVRREVFEEVYDQSDRIGGDTPVEISLTADVSAWSLALDDLGAGDGVYGIPVALQ